VYRVVNIAWLSPAPFLPGSELQSNKLNGAPEDGLDVESHRAYIKNNMNFCCNLMVILV
jgi:hypothetical protein